MCSDFVLGKTQHVVINFQDWLCEGNVCPTRRAEYHGEFSGQKAGDLSEAWEGGHIGPSWSGSDLPERTRGPNSRGRGVPLMELKF